MKLVVLGLSLSSSWGNGHATTWRALLKAMAARGHEILFLERDQPWYAANRDLREPGFCRLALYDGIAELAGWEADISAADLTIIGSYVPDGIALAWLLRGWARHLAFYDIDTPVTLTALERGDCTYLDSEVIRLFDLYLSFTGGPALQHLQTRHGARAARALFCAADPELYSPAAAAGAVPRWDLGYLGTYSADRQAKLERLLIEPAWLLPARRFVVAGPQYPDTIEWPDNVQRIEHLPPREHAAFYRSLGWTLNITRAEMVAAGYSPSVRLFEAAACASPIISDAWQGLGEIFCPGRELLIAQSSEDIVQFLAWPDDARQAVGAQARRRFVACHTADHRACLLEGYAASLG
jgi:spore maturation protein CgeB